MPNFIDINNWDEWDGISVEGSREKQWFVKKPLTNNDIHGHIFLFKESHKRYPWEFWLEIIASKIGEALAINVPKVYCAKRGNKYGALIEFFLKTEWKKNKNTSDGKLLVREDFLRGGDLISFLYPSFDRKLGKDHNIHMVNMVFCKSRNEVLFKEFLNHLVFDAIIGNTDRHQENWGIIQDSATNEKKLAPAFDNTDCLGREIIESNIDKILSNWKSYILRGKPHLRWSDDGITLNRLNHFYFLKKIESNWPFVRDYINQMVLFDDSVIDDILIKSTKIEIDNPIYRLTQKRCCLIKKLLCERRNLLKEQFGV